MKQWSLLTDALTNTQADFYAAAGLLRSLCEDGEAAFGIFLSVFMGGYGGITDKLRSNPVMDGVGERFGVVVGYLLSSSGTSIFLRFKLLTDSSMGLGEPDTLDVSHDEFISFLRAFIGIGSVLAVYAWSDSLPNDRCRERVLGVVRLWQGVGGYREVSTYLSPVLTVSHEVEL